MVCSAGSAPEKLAGIGFEYLFRVTGLTKVFPESETAMILRQLQEVNARLDDISQRVNRIGENVDTLVVLGKQHKFESAATT
ncbi:MAG TPA: hypothetical protein VFJ57_14155 [Solirubrobacterales bacterium]|nr:hypothetical protein [Solirubrobacterales bacterium]